MANAKPGPGGLSFDTNVPEFQKAMRKVPVLLHQHLSKRVEAYLGDFIRRFTRARLSGRPGLYRQTGTLAGRWFPDVSGEKLGDLAWIIYTDVRYAKVHEGKPPGTPYTWTTVLGNTVRMPPRLQFYRTWAEDEKNRTTLIARAAQEALKPQAAGGTA